MTLPAFDHDRPTGLAEAVAAVRAGGVPYCGGTELLATMQMGLLRPERLVSLQRVDELLGIDVENDMLRIGARTTIHAMALSEGVRASSPLLAHVAARIGNIRVRTTGTVGGNLASSGGFRWGPPRRFSCLTTVLIALEAQAVVGDGSSERSLTVDTLISCPYETDLQASELLLRIEVPVRTADVGVYHKATVAERPLVGVALVHLAHRDVWRLVIGAVGEVVLVAEFEKLADIAAAALSGEVATLLGLSGSDAYKRHLTRVTIERCCEDAQRRIREGQ